MSFLTTNKSTSCVKAFLPVIADNQSYLSIQMLRGVAALLVVLLHLAGREQAHNQGVPHLLMPFSSELIGFYAVDTFFIISGFVMCTAHFQDFGIPERIKLYLQKRFIRLFPFYWLTCLPLFFIKHIHINSKFFGSLFLLPLYAGKINTVAWTLAYELIFLSVFAVFMLLPKKALPYLVLGWALCIVIGTSLHLPNLNDCGYFETLISPYNIDFLLGIVLSLLVQQKRFLPPLPLIATGLLIILLAVPFKNAGFWPITPFDHVLMLAIPSFAVTYGLLALEQQRNIRFPTPLIAMGDASYSIYLVHYVVIDALSAVWLQIGSSYAIIPWSLALSLTIPFFCVAIYNFVEKPLFTTLRKRLTKKKISPYPLKNSLQPLDTELSVSNS